MSENSYANALGQYNQMESNVKQFKQNIVDDALKKIDAQSEGIIGASLGTIPAIEVGARYLGKATGTDIEGGVAKVVKGVKSGVAKIKQKLTGNNDETPEEETPESTPETDESTTEQPTELSDMSSESENVSSKTTFSKESEAPKENETPELDYALDNDDEIQPAPREIKTTAENLETKNPAIDEDVAGNVGEDVGEDVAEGVGEDVAETGAVEVGLNSLDAIPVIGELGMVAGAIYGLVHLFHHSKPSIPKTSQIATPTMDVVGDSLNSVSMPTAHI